MRRSLIEKYVTDYDTDMNQIVSASKNLVMNAYRDARRERTGEEWERVDFIDRIDVLIDFLRQCRSKLAQNNTPLMTRSDYASMISKMAGLVYNIVEKRTRDDRLA